MQSQTDNMMFRVLAARKGSMDPNNIPGVDRNGNLVLQTGVLELVGVPRRVEGLWFCNLVVRPIDGHKDVFINRCVDESILPPNLKKNNQIQKSRFR